MRFRPDELSIDRLSIEDGKITLNDAASGATFTLDGVWFNGEARSLAWTLKGEGAATYQRPALSLSSHRRSLYRRRQRTMYISISRPPIIHSRIEADGALTIAGGEPRFDGTVSVSQPVRIGSRGATLSAQGLTQPLTQPWRLSGKIKAAHNRRSCRMSISSMARRIAASGSVALPI